jgi:hypothetical protein
MHTNRDGIVKLMGMVKIQGIVLHTLGIDGLLPIRKLSGMNHMFYICATIKRI